MEEMAARVHGRVQLVMFRDFVKRGARRLRVTGYVRNLPDGTVEVVAQGERAQLERLLERVNRGSLLSRVERVETEWRSPTTPFDAFYITYD